MGKNNDDKKHEEGTKTEGFPTFNEKNEVAADVKNPNPDNPTKEITNVEAKKDEKAETKIKTSKKVAGAIIHSTANFTEMLGGI